MLDYVKRNTLYSFDLSNMIHFFYLNSSVLNHYLTSHGGAFGVLMQLLIVSTFSNYKEQGNNSDFDFFDVVRKKRCELKTASETGVNLIPSNMVGAKREYSGDKYLDALNTIDEYLILDIRKMPMVFLFRIESSSILAKYNLGEELRRKYKAKELDNMIYILSRTNVVNVDNNFYANNSEEINEKLRVDMRIIKKYAK